MVEKAENFEYIGTMSEMPHTANPESTPSRKEVWTMFDRIAHRYDLLNRLLSCGQDVRWRRRMARYLPEQTGLKLLDLATGTADQIIYLMKSSPNIDTAVGTDMSENMLQHGREKLRHLPFGDRIQLKTGDAAVIPVEDDAFDVATISFGIRNVEDVVAALKDMRRALKPGGRMLILEFGLPGNRLLRAAYLLYFRSILPVLGGWISGDHYAYSYLNKTVESFPYGDAFCGLMKEAGFSKVQAHPLTFGVAFIYQGDA